MIFYFIASFAFVLQRHRAKPIPLVVQCLGVAVASSQIFHCGARPPVSTNVVLNIIMRTTRSGVVFVLETYSGTGAYQKSPQCNILNNLAGDNESGDRGDEGDAAGCVVGGFGFRQDGRLF